jgi:hypothetical protein
MAPTATRTDRSGERTTSEVASAIPANGNGKDRNGHTPDHAEAASEPAPTNIRDAGSAIAAAMLQAADPNTGEHSDDVEMIADEICRRMKVNGSEREDILAAARLHDVGKVAIPQSVLQKPEPLDDDEWVLMKEHTIVGERILMSVPELEGPAKLVRHSHEHFDGSGYPDGLAGDDIPLGSRIILCADAFHAIRSDRPYRKGRSTPVALEEMKRCAGSQFDPEVVSALVASVKSSRKLTRRVLPPKLAILFACLAIGGGGAIAAEQGWIPSPIPGLGPEKKDEPATGALDTSSASLKGAVAVAGSAEAKAADDGDDAGGSNGDGGSAATETESGSEASSGRDGRNGGESGSAASIEAGGAAGVHAQGTGAGGQQGGGGGEAGGAGNDPAPHGAAGDAGPGSAGGPSGSVGGGDSSGPAGGGDSGGGSTGGGSSGGGGSGDAPGNSGSAPGQTGSTPGQGGAAPGQSGSNPSAGGAPPGQSGTSPGQSGSTPGQSGAAPGQSGAAPGQSGTAPGHGGTPPGQAGAAPGNSGSAPGQNKPPKP